VEAAVALDLQTALSQYGLVGLYAKNNPEINRVLQAAIAGEWDSARFERSLWDTNWWKTLNETRRALDVMRVTDPATYAQQINNKKAEVGRIASGLGFAVDTAAWAKRALENGWDLATLQQAMVDGNAHNLKKSGAGSFTGQAGEIETMVREMYSAYGLPLTEERIRQVAVGVLSGRHTMGGIEAETRAQARKLYPQFADEIDSGLSVLDIASPYIQTMAATLEMPETYFNLANTQIKQALEYKDPTTGKQTTKPLWMFERELKEDPRWQRTKAARNDTYAILEQIGQDWGMSA
jgi:hypothetical protein